MLQNLLYPLAISMGLNWLMFVPAYLFKTDKLTDISYSLTFIVLAVYGFADSDRSFINQVLLLMIVCWALRLGAYLFYRIHKMGRDTRFDDMRSSVPRFLGFWTLQGLTVFIVSIPSILLFSSNHSSTDLNVISAIGLGIFVIGLRMETVADLQKFRSKMAGHTKWMDTGLWAKIRFPNYTGEMLVWIGVFIFCAGYLPVKDWLTGLISPVFIILLLRYVSGVPLLEKSQVKKWGNDPEYQNYVARTGRLLPKF